MATERITVRAGRLFDPTNPTHLDAVLKTIAEKTDHGTGWKLQSHNPDDGSITLIRQSAITQVSKSSKHRDSYDVGLMAGTKPADGAQVAAQLESDPRHKGYIMTAFEPFLGTATLSKMTTEAIRCRGAVATALGVKPWDVQVTPRADGGFELKLPRGYVPSRHDVKLQEVAEAVVGRDGWYVTTDPQKLTASIIPADPPTFPAVIPYPLSQARKVNSESRLLLATALGKNGNATGETIYLDFDASPHTSLTGTVGSGKTVTINSLIVGALASGYELAIIDVPHKAVDFTWARRYVHSGFWGCDSLEAAATVATLVYEEGQRRADILKTHDVTKISELPKSLQPRPLLVVMDEVSGLFQPDDVPKGIPKDHPLVVAALDANGKRAILMGMTLKLAAEMRFVGIRLLLSTQVANATTGIPPKLRSLLTNKLLQGVNTTEAIRRQVFNDPTAVPAVPGNIRADSKVAKGVGVLEMEGAEPTVYKGFYAAAGDYLKLLSSMGIEETTSPSPSPDDIARVTQSLDADDEPRSDYRGRRSDGLTGAAAAAHDLRTAAA